MKYRRAAKPDAQPFDEIRLVTLPRFKTSGMSGDEWRISVAVEFYRKGRLVKREGCGSRMDYAVAMLGWYYHRAVDDGHGYYAGERDYCDQEGCSKQAVVAYRVKREFSRDNPHEWSKPAGGDSLLGVPVRLFCDEHRRRGDAGFDDSDDNYEEIPIGDVVAAKKEPGA